MKTTRCFLNKLFFITVISIAFSTAAHAEEIIDRLSLRHDDIRLVTDDPKKPAPSLLTAKFGFRESSGFMPYLGTGLVYTLQQDEKKKDKMISTGIAGQAGFSYLLDKNSSLNIDYKYLHMPPDSKNNDSSPQSIGIGVKIKF